MKSVKAKTSITYHDRSGKPKIHWNKQGRAYIMVRKSPKGTKRLYLDSKEAKKSITKGYSNLVKEAKERQPEMGKKRGRKKKSKKKKGKKYGKIGAPNSKKRKAWMRKIRKKRG